LLVYFLERLSARPDRVLDAGCGDARPLIELVRNGFDVRGFDYSEDMLEAGKENLTKAELSPALIKLGDIYDIPEENSAYDAIACMGVVENLPDHDVIFSEFRRVLKPGGDLIISLENDLFSYFSVNAHSLKYWRRLFKEAGVADDICDDVIRKMSALSGVDQIKRIKKSFEDAEIDKSSVHIETYNPLNVREKLEKMGFDYVDHRYFHYHPIPPRFETEYPDVFADVAERLETTEYDWKGGILCNCMVVHARVSGG